MEEKKRIESDDDEMFTQRKNTQENPKVGRERNLWEGERGRFYG